MSDESITVENCSQFMEKQKASKNKKLKVEKTIKVGRYPWG